MIGWEEARRQLDEIERVRCEDSLLYFFEKAWKVLDSAPIKLNWHHEEIAYRLERLAWGDSEFRNILINQPPRTTKALDCDTPVLTTWGWKRHGDLAVDDFVFGPDGKPKRVLGLSPQTRKPAYEIEFDDGVKITASGDHLWSILREFPCGGPRSTRVRKTVIVTTEELLSRDALKGGMRHQQRPDAVPVSAEIKLAPRNLLVDPYLLGVWLGDGTATSANMTCGEQDLEHFRRLGVVVRDDPPRGNGSRVYRILLGAKEGHSIRERTYMRLQARLRFLDVLGNKHIPSEYMEAGVEQRWQLLRGLMDTDGSATRTECRFTSSIERLADQVQSLACSLGLKAHKRTDYATLNGRRYGPYHIISFTPPEGCRIFNLERKHAQTSFAQNTRSTNRYIKSVLPVGEKTVNCIKVEGDLYLAGHHFVTTHNTLLTNICFPAWVWIQPESRWGPLSGPHVKFLCACYGATLSETLGQKHLLLVQSEWYQKHWGDRVKLDPQRMSRADFANTAGGERLSTSIHGALLGRGGDYQIIDDPQDPEGAESDAERGSTIRAFSEGLPTRITDPATAARIMVMQRLHDMDCTGWVLTNEPERWLHMCFPMRAELYRLSPGDPRTEEGELLWPDHWPEEKVREFERLGDYFVAGQFQQRPVPRGGGVFKREWIEPWPPFNSDGTWPVEHIRAVKRNDAGQVTSGIFRYPAFEYIAGWVDGAFTQKQENDFCAMVVAGVYRAEGRGRIERGPDGSWRRVADDYGYPKVLIIAGWLKRLIIHGPPEQIPPGVSKEEWNSPIWRAERQKQWGLVEWVADTATRYKLDHLGINALGGGHVLEAELRRQYADLACGVELYTERVDKVARAMSVVGLFSSGQFFFPAFEDGTYPTWLEPMADQLFTFPRGQHDDAVDALVNLAIHLRSIGMFERREEFVRDEVGLTEYRTNKPVVLPYPL